MTIWNDCQKLLERDYWPNKKIAPLVSSVKHCPLCRFLCDFFEIPVDSIRNRTAWPTAEQMKFLEEESDWPGHGLDYSVNFKVVGAKSPLRGIVGELVPEGPSRSYRAPREAKLPLGYIKIYSDHSKKLGLYKTSRRGIWSNAGPASLAARISTVVEFIDACHSHHPQCLQKTKDHLTLPSRFVVVGSHDGGAEPRLVSSSGTLSTEKYITLSHNWGANPDSMPLRTTRSTKAAHTVSIPMASLLRTFRGAVSVTRALGIRYIWIDSLCIVQDDLKDWEKEAAKMAGIYEGSFLTIAAVDSPNSNGGLFLDSITPPSHFNFVASDGFAKSPQVKSTAFVRELHEPLSNEGKLHLYNAPLYRRGWVFQELMLSSRSLHFREHQMYWKCHSGTRSEDGSVNEFEEKAMALNLFSEVGERPDNFSSPRVSTATWWKWVGNYTTRDLTRSEDRTAAMTGMIRYFECLTGDNPMLGLWESSFICDLHWSVIGKVANTPSTSPSWSWLSHHGKPIFHQPHEDWFGRESDMLELCLESFNLQWSGSPFTSKLIRSTLQVSGVIRSFKVTNPRSQSGFHIPHPDPSCRGYIAEVHCTLDDGSEIFDGLDITCLFMFYYTEHIETEGPEGDSHGRSHRWECFLIISPQSPSGHSVSDPIVISDSDEVTPAPYRSLGVGHFEIELVSKDEWVRLTHLEYNTTGARNPSLMFHGCDCVTVELV